jgi:hypothetical protein
LFSVHTDALLAAAADALLAGDAALARLKLRRANDPVLCTYASRSETVVSDSLHTNGRDS